MRNTDYFKGKKAVIIGLARSGLACANLLHGLGARVFISDNRDNEFTRLNAEKLDSSEIKCELGRHSSEYVDGSDFMVISPGVDDSAQPVVWAKQKGIPVLSEIEIAWLLCPATVIAVTGSNGKTTVTTLIGKVIEASGRKAFICGNIGNPFSNVVPETGEDDFVSLEVSSFQLEHIRSFKPKISVILNFSRNHLDRYKNMEEYLEAKKRIFLNQDSSDFLISNAQDPVLKEAVSSCRAKKVFFSGENGISPNQSAVLAVASILNIEKDTCLKVFSEFKGLEHRLEYVAEIGGVKFINDSKATTVESCVMALDSLQGKVVLIAGGRHKGVDYGLAVGAAKKKVKNLILIGEAEEKIRKVFEGILPIDRADTLAEAVKIAYSKAGRGDFVLLSPMCSSFDMFSDFEERGRVFKAAVRGLLRG